MEYSDLFFEFICRHALDDTDRLLLSPPKDIDTAFLRDAVQQISLRRKFAAKFPRLLANQRFIIADRSVGEQASSEATASYLPLLAPEARRVVDLSAGMGVNTFSFATESDCVTAIELSGQRADILRHNLNVLGLDNVEVVSDDCCLWLEKTSDRYDIAFIDPARRDAKGVRSISLQNYSPDLFQILPLIKKKTDRLLVKVSPLFDLDKALKEIPEITAFHIVEYRGECKELILDMDFSLKRNFPIIRCVEVFDDRTPKISEYPFSKSSINEMDYLVSSDTQIKPGSFVLIPSPALRKARLIDKVLLQFPDAKLLSPNTMLLLSNTDVDNFPGRKFSIEAILDKKDLRSLKGTHCNVLARNYPLSSEALASCFNLKPSGPLYLLATTLRNSRIHILMRLITPSFPLS